ncbi:hypothetical protein [Rhodanobacter sp. L36]|uniref:hypothetical protein n=1 Tax=Rhodanobacter sp. L36 TaxID=1747221 RepID=UPI00131D62C2|nr:hypothetical protein [Rhodanobacter sp. L36]
MISDNRISAVLSEQDVATVQGALATMRELLPFLVTLSAQDRREMPRLGLKSVGFDEKCVTYMASRAQFVPGFINTADLQKDRQLRSQLMRFATELQTLAMSVDDTLQSVSSELWMADLAYYQSVREAAHRGHEDAHDVYEDLSQGFPGPRVGRVASETTAA